jgi:hypothetical protein
MTGLDLADTAVKIGLGALITGVATYLNSKLGFKRDAAKTYSTRRRELLENIGEQIEGFTHVALRFWARASGIGKTLEKGGEISQEQSDRFGATVDELFDAFKNLSTAEARLLLLGEDLAQQRVREYGELIQTLQGAIDAAGSFSESKSKEWRLRILEARQAVFKGWEMIIELRSKEPRNSTQESATEWQLKLVVWEFFCTLTWSGRARSCLRKRRTHVTRWLRYWARTVRPAVADPLNKLAFVIRWERGEIGGLPHCHILISRFPERSINPSTYFAMVNTWKHGISQVRLYDPYGPGDVARYLSKGRFSSAADCGRANTYELRKFHRADWIYPRAWAEMREARTVAMRVSPLSS